MNLANNLLTAATHGPDAVALSVRPNKITYRDLQASARATAGWLRSQGARPDDRIALIMPNETASQVLFYGSVLTAVTVVPVNSLLSQQKIHHHFTDTGVGTAFGAMPDGGRAEATADDCSSVVVVGTHGSSSTALVSVEPRADPTSCENNYIAVQRVAALELIRERRLGMFEEVPTVYSALLRATDATRSDTPSLRLCLSSGAALPIELLQAFERRFDTTILEGDALSGTSSVVPSNHPDRAGDRPVKVIGRSPRVRRHQVATTLMGGTMTTAADAVDLAEADLTDLDRQWVGELPPALFGPTRSEAPVRPNPSADCHGFWTLTRRADLSEVSRSPHDISRAPEGSFLRPGPLGPPEERGWPTLHNTIPNFRLHARASVERPAVVRRTARRPAVVRYADYRIARQARADYVALGIEVLGRNHHEGAKHARPDADCALNEVPA